MRLTPALILLSMAVALGLAAPALAETAAAGEAPAAAPVAGAPAAAPVAAPVAEVLPAISVTTATVRPMTDRVIASGLIGPVEEVQVQPRIEGQPIEQLLVDVGDRVEEGQVLAILSKITLELQRAQSNASLAAAKATICLLYTSPSPRD